MLSKCLLIPETSPLCGEQTHSTDSAVELRQRRVAERQNMAGCHPHSHGVPPWKPTVEGMSLRSPCSAAPSHLLQSSLPPSLCAQLGISDIASLKSIFLSALPP